MNVSYPIAEKLVARIQARRGKPASIVDLLDVGSRPAIKQALSRLAKDGTIQRVGRGIYAWPRFSILFQEPVPPSIDALAKAWARSNSLRIIPSGAFAANLLGISTQVPSKYVYYTNGRTQRVRLGGTSVQFLNRGPKTMDIKGELAAHVFQALRHLGRNGATPEVIARVRRLIRPRDRVDVQRSMHLAPVWMKPVLSLICREDVN
ncbi:MAG TPA: hypothetical protein DCS43_05395 [Verrucomicrobia bacterium]|nr:hypothetical protein [Verrucomicrobiota bacterium]